MGSAYRNIPSATHMHMGHRGIACYHHGVCWIALNELYPKIDLLYLSYDFPILGGFHPKNIPKNRIPPIKCVIRIQWCREYLCYFPVDVFYSKIQSKHDKKFNPCMIFRQSACGATKSSQKKFGPHNESRKWNSKNVRKVHTMHRNVIY